MIPYKQLALAEVFEDCQNKFDNDKYQFLSLLDQTINLLCRMETLGELMAVLDTCTEAQRRRFLLYALEGLSYAEIGTICGCSKYSVRDSIIAVRKIFKDFFENRPHE